MFWFREHPKQVPNRPVEAATLRKVAETCDWLCRIKAEPPLSIVSGAGGPLIRWAGMIFSVYFAVTTTVITARSGTTAGYGTARIQTFNGTDFADLGGPSDWKVFNFSGAGGGIPAGKYCVILRIAGFYWIIAVEC